MARGKAVGLGSAVAVVAGAALGWARAAAFREGLRNGLRSGLRSLSIPLRQVLLGISVAGECGGLLSHELFWGVDPDGSGQG